MITYLYTHDVFVFESYHDHSQGRGSLIGSGNRFGIGQACLHECSGNGHGTGFGCSCGMGTGNGRGECGLAETSLTSLGETTYMVLEGPA